MLSQDEDDILFAQIDEDSVIAQALLKDDKPPETKRESASSLLKDDKPPETKRESASLLLKDDTPPEIKRESASSLLIDDTPPEIKRASDSSPSPVMNWEKENDPSQLMNVHIEARPNPSSWSEFLHPRKEARQEGEKINFALARIHSDGLKKAVGVNKDTFVPPYPNLSRNNVDVNAGAAVTVGGGARSRTNDSKLKRGNCKKALWTVPEPVGSFKATDALFNVGCNASSKSTPKSKPTKKAPPSSSSSSRGTNQPTLMSVIEKSKKSNQNQPNQQSSSTFKASVTTLDATSTSLPSLDDDKQHTGVATKMHFEEMCKKRYTWIALCKFFGFHHDWDKCFVKQFNLGWLKKGFMITEPIKIPLLVCAVQKILKGENSTRLVLEDHSGNLVVDIDPVIMRRFGNEIKWDSSLAIVGMQWDPTKDDSKQEITILPENLLAISTSHIIPTQLQNKPISLNPFPYYFGYEPETVIVQLCYWNPADLPTECNRLANLRQPTD